MKFKKLFLFLFVAFVSFNFFSAGNFLGVTKVEAAVDLTISSGNYGIMNWQMEDLSMTRTVGVYYNFGQYFSNIGTTPVSGKTTVHLLQTARGFNTSFGVDPFDVVDYPFTVNEDLSQNLIGLRTSYKATVAERIAMRICIDKSSATDPVGAIPESNENNNCGDWNWVTFDEPINPISTPDLQVSLNVTPIATIAGDTTFSATIKNYGTATTGAGFKNLFQTATSIADLNNPTGLLKYTVTGMATLAPSATAVTSKTLTLAVGKIYIRACADNNASMIGAIDEGTNEGNNCSDWIAVTVGSPSTNCTDKTQVSYGLPLPCFNNPAFCKNPLDPNYGKAACTVDPCGGNGATNPPLCTVKCE